MIDGITILHTYTHTTPVAYLAAIWIVFGLLAAITLWSWLKLSSKTTGWRIVLAVLLTLLTIASFIMALSFEEKSETRYKILIDENISYQDFVEHYEVIDVEGKIYTVRVINSIPSTTEPPSEPSNPSTEPSIENPTETQTPTWDPDAVG